MKRIYNKFKGYTLEDCDCRCRLFCSYAAAYADYDIWNNDDCFLCALQYCRQHFGIPPCAENL